MKGCLLRYLTSEIGMGRNENAKTDVMTRRSPVAKWMRNNPEPFNVRHLVGDLEEIDGPFETLREAVVNQRSCCIELQPEDNHMNDERVFARSKAIASLTCQVAMKSLSRNLLNKGCHYVSNNEHVKELVERLGNAKGQAVVWINLHDEEATS